MGWFDVHQNTIYRIGDNRKISIALPFKISYNKRFSTWISYICKVLNSNINFTASWSNGLYFWSSNENLSLMDFEKFRQSWNQSFTPFTNLNKTLFFIANFNMTIWKISKHKQVITILWLGRKVIFQYFRILILTHRRNFS